MSFHVDRPSAILGRRGVRHALPSLQKVHRSHNFPRHVELPRSCEMLSMGRRQAVLNPKLSSRLRFFFIGASPKPRHHGDFGTHHCGPHHFDHRGPCGLGWGRPGFGSRLDAMTLMNKAIVKCFRPCTRTQRVIITDAARTAGHRCDSRLVTLRLIRASS
jgi:hypothetical protein